MGRDFLHRHACFLAKESRIPKSVSKPVAELTALFLRQGNATGFRRRGEKIADLARLLLQAGARKIDSVEVVT